MIDNVSLICYAWIVKYIHCLPASEVLQQGKGSHRILCFLPGKQPASGLWSDPQSCPRKVREQVQVSIMGEDVDGYGMQRAG